MPSKKPKTKTKRKPQTEPREETNPLLRPLLALARILVMPDERENEQRERELLIEAFTEVGPHSRPFEWVTIDELRRDVACVLLGGIHSWKATDTARAEAEDLAAKLVDGIFDLHRQPLSAFVPELVKRDKAQREAAETARRAALRKRWKAEDAKSAKARRSSSPAAKKAAAKKAAATKSAKKATAKPSQGKKNAKPKAKQNGVTPQLPGLESAGEGAA